MDKSKPLSIIIADDFPLLLLGMATFLKSQLTIKLIKQVKGGLELINELEESNGAYDLAILDVFSGVISSLDTTAYIKQKFPKLKVIGFSMHADEYYVLQMFKNGADGYLLKTLPQEELISSVSEVMAGKKYFQGNIKAMLSHSKESNKEIDIIRNTHTQEVLHEIIFLLCYEKSNAEIAEILNLSVRTIEKYRGVLIELFKSNNIIGIIKYGMRINILEDIRLKKKFEKYLNTHFEYNLRSA